MNRPANLNRFLKDRLLADWQAGKLTREQTIDGLTGHPHNLDRRDADWMLTQLEKQGAKNGA